VEVARRFHSLEGLRGLAAVAVALTHLGLFWRHIVCHGYLAVDLFFLLSGVVLGHAYEARLAGGWGPAKFLAARIQRLAPLYLLGALWGGICAFVLTSHGVGPNQAGLKFLLALSFVPLLLGTGPIYPLNAPSWSLFDEFAANTVFGFVAPMLNERRLKVAIGVAFCALCIATFYTGSIGEIDGAKGTNWPGGILRAAFSFPLGLLLHRWHVAGRLPKPHMSAWLVAAIVFASFFVPLETPLYDVAVVGLLYPGLIVVALANEPRGETLIRLFDFAGLISYPLYVLHWPLAHLLRAATADSVGVGVGVGFLAVSTLLAYLAACFYDTPVRDWLRNRSRSATPPLGALAKSEENPVSALAERASSPL
jgi:peptidoglycan/LPS O-acetylase OafA/YrhL